MTDPRSDPFRALRQHITPVDPDPAFAAELRSRLERALLAPQGAPMTTTERAVDVPLRSLTPMLGFDDGHRALDWYVDALGARRRGEPYLMPDGGIGHAELVIGDSVLMLAGGPPGGSAPQPVHGFRAFLHLQVPDPDAVVRRAVELGAELERPVADQPYGRTGIIIDPFGHRWMIRAGAPSSQHGELAYLTHAVADTEHARAFYGAVLGWTFRPGRVEDGWQIEGTFPPAGMHGGAATPGIEPVYQVDDLAAALAAVRDHGGQTGEPQQQPYGRIAECTDDQGAHFQLLQP
ncbi:MAG: VOC family protein [Pseudonocardiaceae bacterium]